MTTLVNALEQRGGRYGLQTMCEGGGMAMPPSSSGFEACLPDCTQGRGLGAFRDPACNLQSPDMHKGPALVVWVGHLREISVVIEHHHQSSPVERPALFL
jgi:hypothetical protein